MVKTYPEGAAAARFQIGGMTGKRQTKVCKNSRVA